MSNTQHKLFIEHSASRADLETVNAVREQSAPFKGTLNGAHARESYDQMIEATPAAADIQYQSAAIADVPGVWCRHTQAPQDTAILYLHGGGYVVGTANAYRHFAGQFASRTRTDVFVADYSLAPEYPFPTALNQAQAVYRGLLEAGYQRIVVVGDSAGGGLSLALIAQLAEEKVTAPACCLALSPWTDLTLSGASHQDKAEDELYLTTSAIGELAQQYLAGQDPRTPAISPLFGTLKGLPDIQIHVGTAEILLSDSLEYTTRASAAGTSIQTHVWEAMPHVFSNGLALFEAANLSMTMACEFIQSHLTAKKGGLYESAV